MNIGIDIDGVNTNIDFLGILGKKKPILDKESSNLKVNNFLIRKILYKGIAFYWGWGKLLNSYTGKLIASSLQGRRALRLADMHDVFNGLAPAWFNENGTHGGQLGSGVVEMFYDADEEQQKLLEAARLNPTVMHPTFGCVLTRESDMFCYFFTW